MWNEEESFAKNNERKGRMSRLVGSPTEKQQNKNNKITGQNYIPHAPSPPPHHHHHTHTNKTHIMMLVFLLILEL